MQKSEPCVQLKVDMKPFAEASEDWEPPLINSTSPILPPNREQSNAITIQQTEKQEIQTGFQGLFMNQVTLSNICKIPNSKRYINKNISKMYIIFF